MGARIGDIYSGNPLFGYVRISDQAIIAGCWLGFDYWFNGGNDAEEVRAVCEEGAQEG